ncbi:MAG: DNA polymerase ligase N-terminal domain-containing protein [Candidatus Zixiibacteriota bacterium]
MSDSKLDKYNKKRDFKKTTEPGDKEVDFDWAEHPIFVIQKHDASNLHYDVRIEIDDVLKSWAVPKGPSTNPKTRRLMLPTEDHPLGYADFEGVIPEDEYGGGTVMVWDRGSYHKIEDDDEEKGTVKEQFEDGHINIYLEGEKIKGGYAFIRTDDGEDAKWLMIKMKDDWADARRKPTSTDKKSVKTGRSMEEIAKEEEPIPKKDD